MAKELEKTHREDKERVLKYVGKTAKIAASAFKLGTCHVMSAVEAGDAVLSEGLVEIGYARVSNIKGIRGSKAKTTLDWKFTNGQDVLVSSDGAKSFQTMQALLDCVVEYKTEAYMWSGNVVF